MERIHEIMNLVLDLVPEGTDEIVQLDNVKMRIFKNKNTKGFEAVVDSTPEAFDDSHTLQEIAHYKEILDELEDCMFLEICEDLSESMNIQEFDKLLNKEHFNEEESAVVLHAINRSKEIVRKHICDAIESLQGLLNKLD